MTLVTLMKNVHVLFCLILSGNCVFFPTVSLHCSLERSLLKMFLDGMHSTCRLLVRTMQYRPFLKHSKCSKYRRLHNSTFFQSDVSTADSTIFSLSSGHGKCGVAVIRVSGSGTKTVLQQISGIKKIPTPRLANLRTLVNPKTGVNIDRGLVLYFEGKFHDLTRKPCQ